MSNRYNIIQKGYIIIMFAKDDDVMTSRVADDEVVTSRDTSDVIGAVF